MYTYYSHKIPNEKRFYLVFTGARFLPKGGGLASIFRFLHRSESVGERRRTKIAAFSDPDCDELDSPVPD